MGTMTADVWLWIALGTNVLMALCSVFQAARLWQERNRRRVEFETLKADLKTGVEAELRAYVRALPDRWAEFMADPTHPKWQNGLFYEDADADSVH